MKIEGNLKNASNLTVYDIDEGECFQYLNDDESLFLKGDDCYIDLKTGLCCYYSDILRSSSFVLPVSAKIVINE